MSSSLAEVVGRVIQRQAEPVAANGHRKEPERGVMGRASSDSAAPDDELDPKRLLVKLEVLDLRLSVDRLEVAILRRALKAKIARSHGNCAPPAKKIETLDQFVAALTSPGQN